MLRSAIALVLLSACTSSGGDGPTSCSLRDEGDAGALPALFAQRCNVPGSMGARKWYRLAATLPDASAGMAVVQLELYDGAGPFTGGAVRTGTFPVDTDPLTCGVCLRALADKGGADQLAYIAIAGSVTITSIGEGGAQLAAAIAGATFTEVDADQAVVIGGCTAEVAAATLSGTIEDRGGTGGGGGGGGGGGTGACATTIGDPDKL